MCVFRKAKLIDNLFFSFISQVSDLLSKNSKTFKMPGVSKLTCVLIIVLVAYLEMSTAALRRTPRCPNPPATGWPEPTGCIYGFARDICGKLSCAMGPGEICKYKRFRSSNCGEGTFCHCSRCMGCSLFSYTCFETTCVFAMSQRR